MITALVKDFDLTNCEPRQVRLDRARQTFFVSQYIKQYIESGQRDFEVSDTIENEAGGGYDVDIIEEFQDAMGHDWSWLNDCHTDLEDKIEEGLQHGERKPSLEVVMSVMRVAMVEKQEDFETKAQWDDGFEPLALEG